MSTLNLRDQFIKKLSKVGALAHNGFIRVINQIMIHHNGPILKFVLFIPNIVLDSFQEVDQWMLILSRNGVRELIIGNSNQIYPIPSSVFSCLEMRTLRLYNCIFKPPLEFQGFLNLEIIILKRVNFGGYLGGTVINLPHLTKLMLVECDNVNNFNIKAEKLQTLKVYSCPDAMLLRFLHSEHLDVVHICFLKRIEDFLRVERFSLATMLFNLPNLTHFTIDGYFLKFLAAEKFPKWLPCAVKGLKKLEFKSFSVGDLDQVQGALCIIRNSPNLKELRVTHMQMGHETDLELTSNYLESPDCLHQTLFMLQTVEMASLEGSRPELLFIKLLLDHSPHLENMIIRPRATADAQKVLNIAKAVMLFPRASANAKMVYLDPQP
ncbi:hypothetical protein L1987_83705 [Smallanthus sonchifolius]|uniref:Uncharacterized protein n=1 Tax=Smallanthus sonchifolius TaxID=185202 RepID=A0ACB8YCP8_9ASTR|nr:hypothetical protein L1987_83705 [Smallanthus sonchifolius]